MTSFLLGDQASIGDLQDLESFDDTLPRAGSRHVNPYHLFNYRHEGLDDCVVHGGMCFVWSGSVCLLRPVNKSTVLSGYVLSCTASVKCQMCILCHLAVSPRLLDKSLCRYRCSRYIGD